MRLRHFLALLLAGAALIGCASPGPAVSVRGVTLPSGERGLSIACANAHSVNACYETAGDLCPRGYEVFGQQQESGFSGGGSRVGDVATSSVSSSWQRGLLVKCKGDSTNAGYAAARRMEAERKQEIEARQTGRGFAVVFVFTVSLIALMAILNGG